MVSLVAYGLVLLAQTSELAAICSASWHARASSSAFVLHEAAARSAVPALVLLPGRWCWRCHLTPGFETAQSASSTTGGA